MLSRPVYLAPYPPEYQYKLFANSNYIKLTETEYVSIMNINQVNFSCFLCRIVHMLGCRVGGKLSRPVYLALTHLIIKVKLFCSLYLFLII